MILLQTCSSCYKGNFGTSRYVKCHSHSMYGKQANLTAKVNSSFSRVEICRPKINYLACMCISNNFLVAIFMCQRLLESHLSFLLVTCWLVNQPPLLFFSTLTKRRGWALMWAQCFFSQKQKDNGLPQFLHV